MEMKKAHLVLQSCGKGRDPNVAVRNVMGLGLEPA